MAETMTRAKPARSASPASSLPTVDDVPRVRAVLDRAAAVSRDLAAAKQRKAEIEALLPQREFASILPIASADERRRDLAKQIEARRAAGLAATDADRQLQALAELPQVEDRIATLRDAAEIVAAELRAARSAAASEFREQVAVAAEPLMRRAASSLLDALAAWNALTKLREALVRRGLSTEPTSITGIPQTPFVHGLMPDSQTRLNGIGRMIAMLAEAELITSAEAASFRSQFPGCG